MSYQRRTEPTLFCFAFIFLSICACFGQSGTDSDRSRSVNPKPSPQKVPAKDQKQLPFEKSVIITYKVPGNAGKVYVSTNRPVTSLERYPSAKVESKKKEPDTTVSAVGPAIPLHSFRSLDSILEMRPVLIYYPSPRPSTTDKRSEKLPVNSFAKAEASAESAIKSKAILEFAEVKTSNQAAPSIKPLAAAANRPAEFPTHLIPTAGSEATAMRRENIEVPEPSAEKTLVKVENAQDDTPEKTADAEKRVGSPQDAINDPAALGDVMTASLNVSPEKALKVTSTVATGESASATVPAADPVLTAADGTVGVVALNNSAVRLTKEARYGEAEELLKQAIADLPTVAKFHRNLSIVFEREGKFDEALDSACVAAKLAPSDPSVLDQLCVLELARGSATLAVTCFEKFNSIEPLDVLLQTYFGTALFRSGKLDEAIPVLEIAAQSTPPIGEAFNALGVVYYKKKRFKDSIAAFKNAVETDPEMYEFRFNLAIAQLTKQNRAAALSQYNILKKANSKLAEKLYRMLYGDKLVFAGDFESKN